MSFMITLAVTFCLSSCAAQKSTWHRYVQHADEAMEAGDFEEAAELLAKAYEKSKLIRGAKVKLADSLRKLGRHYRHNDKLILAGNAYQKELKVREADVDGDKVKLHRCLKHIGDTKFELGNYDSAAHFYKRAVKVWEEVKGREETLAKLYCRLGQSYAKKSSFRRGIPYYVKAKEINERLLDPLDYENIRNLHGLARAYYKTGQKEKADEIYAKEFELVEKAPEKNFTDPNKPKLNYLRSIAQERAGIARHLGHMKEASEFQDKFEIYDKEYSKKREKARRGEVP